MEEGRKKAAGSANYLCRGSVCACIKRVLCVIKNSRLHCAPDVAVAFLLLLPAMPLFHTVLIRSVCDVVKIALGIRDELFTQGSHFLHTQVLSVFPSSSFLPATELIIGDDCLL